jgi:tRNA 2-selenouridine synthase
MANRISIQEFMDRAQKLPVLDVRAPKEFSTGHIPAAHSFPIFDDEQRAIVGTAYKQQGHDPAVLLGLDLFGPRMSGFVKEAEKLAINKELLVHCWRGGMRSGAMAWLLSFAGFKVHLLEGGYKAFRHLMLEQFEKPFQPLILGGLTGSGKTDILHYLQKFGEQVIDHKGSAFGAIGMEPQPSTEHFENLLGMQLLKANPEQSVWLEDESSTIGRVVLPKPFFNQMLSAPTIMLKVPQKLRVQKLTEEYCRAEKEKLSGAILRIKKRLGGLATKEAIEAIEKGDMERMVEIALSYYDKTYQFDLNKRKQVLQLELHSISPEENAEIIMQFAKQNNLI